MWQILTRKVQNKSKSIYYPSAPAEVYLFVTYFMYYQENTHTNTPGSMALPLTQCLSTEVKPSHWEHHSFQTERNRDCGASVWLCLSLYNIHIYRQANRNFPPQGHQDKMVWGRDVLFTSCQWQHGLLAATQHWIRHTETPSLCCLSLALPVFVLNSLHDSFSPCCINSWLFPIFASSPPQKSTYEMKL